MTYPNPNFSIDLGGQVALVTGATSGLGWRFAKVLAWSGAKVAIAGRRRDRLDQLVAEISTDGGTAFPITLDVADAAALPRAVDEVEKALGMVSILVNNAGIPDAALATKMSLELINRVIDVNLRAPFVLASDVARRLIKAKRPGRIVNIASMAAYSIDMAGVALYSTTKAGVVRMTEALAVEWAAHNINVNAIAPGAFDSEMLAGMLSRIGDEFVQSFPRKRTGNPAQLDSTLLYLVSPSSECVTGTCIRVDDGQSPR